MTRVGLAIATILMLGSTAQIQAVPIIYTLATTASGTLGGTPFTNAPVVVTLTGDTANVTAGPAPYTDTVVNTGNATVTIAGVGTANFTDQIAILSTLTDTALFGVPAVLITDNTTGGTGLLLQTASVYTTYDLKSSIGPISGTGGVASGSHGATPVFATTAGNLTWTTFQTLGISTFTAVALTSLTPQSGWWWDPNLSGEGFFLEYGGQSGSGMFLAGFFSDPSGSPTWLVSIGSMSGTTYAGTWLKATGGQALLGSYRNPTLSAAGAISITFTDSSHAVLTRPDGTTVNIQRYGFSAGGVAPPETGTAQVGWWWGGTALSGSGYAIEFQGNSVFIAAYVYDNAGNPVWYLATGALTSPTSYTGTWDSYSGGPQLTSPEGSYPSHKTGSASPLTLTFTDSTHGTLTMGTVSIPITRYQSF